MTDWRDTAREMIASGMSVNNVSREIGKSEHSVRFQLNINGFADRHRARKEALRNGTFEKPATTPRRVEPEASIVKTITLPSISLRPVDDEPATPRKANPHIRVRAEHPRIALIRETHQRMIRQGKIPGRDLMSEWRS